jgi:hypothetical protein
VVKRFTFLLFSKLELCEDPHMHSQYHGMIRVPTRVFCGRMHKNPHQHACKACDLVWAGPFEAQALKPLEWRASIGFSA